MELIKNDSIWQISASQSTSLKSPFGVLVSLFARLGLNFVRCGEVVETLSVKIRAQMNAKKLGRCPKKAYYNPYKLIQFCQSDHIIEFVL